MGETDQSWQNVGEKFTELGRKFRQHYEARGETTEPATEESPEEIPAEESSEMKQALETIGDGLERVFGSIGDSLQDDEVKAQARSAFSSLLDAIGETFSELGDEVRSMGQRRKAEEGADDAPPAEDFEPDGVKELREDLQGD